MEVRLLVREREEVAILEWMMFGCVAAAAAKEKTYIIPTLYIYIPFVASKTEKRRKREYDKNRLNDRLCTPD